MDLGYSAGQGAFGRLKEPADLGASLAVDPHRRHVRKSDHAVFIADIATQN